VDERSCEKQSAQAEANTADDELREQESAQEV